MTELWWHDVDSAWHVKMRRAAEHIDALRRDAAALASGGTYDLVAEPGPGEGETTYRLLMSRPVPTDFSATIGDALQNLRAALDCAAFGIAQRNVGRDLTAKEENACKFPIYSTVDGFEDFFRGAVHQRLFGPSKEAFRTVQPAAQEDFWETRRPAVAGDRSDREWAVAYDPLYQLNQLANTDKHRRLHLTTPWLEHIYWQADDLSNPQWRWGRPPLSDGSVVGVLVADPEHPAPPPQLHHDLQLRIWHQPPEEASRLDLLVATVVSRTEVVRLLTGVHARVTSTVFPRIFSDATDGLMPPV